MTGNLMLDVFAFGVVFGYGFYFCVDILTQKKPEFKIGKYPDPPSS